MIDYERILELKEGREYAREHAIDNAIDILKLPDFKKHEKLWNELYNTVNRLDRKFIFLQMIRLEFDIVLQCMEQNWNTIEVPKLGTFKFKSGKKAYQDLKEKYKGDKDAIQEEMLLMKEDGAFMEKRHKSDLKIW